MRSEAGCQGRREDRCKCGEEACTSHRRKGQVPRSKTPRRSYEKYIYLYALLNAFLFLNHVTLLLLVDKVILCEDHTANGCLATATSDGHHHQNHHHSHLESHRL
ncbi:unnamed protein product [Mortierella alpina]